MTLNANDKAKMAAARVLIGEQRYSEARALLVGIPDATATAWILRIDELIGKNSQTHDSAKRNLFGGLSLILFVVFFIAVFFAAQNDAYYYGRAAAGIVAIVALLSAYATNRIARRYKSN